MGLLDRLRAPVAPVNSAGLLASAHADTSLVGAAVVVGDPLAGAGGKPGRREKWVGEAWDYYDGVGELHYSGSFIANCLMRVRLRPGWLGDDDAIGPVYDDDGKPIEGVDAEMADIAQNMIRELKAQLGGQASLLADFGKNITIAADCYFLGMDTLGADGEVVDRAWECLSTDELKPAEVKTVNGKPVQTWRRFRVPGGTGEDVPIDARVIRVWRRHPRFSALADSAVRPLMDVLEELVLLTRTVRATATSRLAGAGVYWIPKEIEFPRTPDTPEGVEPFTHQMITAMTTPIKDRGSAASVVPLVARAKGEAIAQVRYDRFDPPDDTVAILKRTEAVQRLGNGLDLPLEVVTGQGGSNHWSAWQIDESTFKAHIEPLLELLSDALSIAYLHPGLRVASGMMPGTPTPEAIARFRVWYDATELVVHPNREQAAEHAYGTVSSPNLAISHASYRRAKGFTDADAPDDEEIAQRLAWAQAVKIRESIDTLTPGAAEASGDVSTEVPGQNEGKPASDPTGASVDVLASAAARRLVLQLAAVSDLAVERAVDRAGSRLRSKLNGKATPEVRDVLSRTANADVARVIGPDAATRLIPLPEMFTGEFTTFDRLVRRYASAAGITGDPAERLAAAACEHIGSTANKRLHDPSAEVDVMELVGIVAAALDD